MVSQAATGDRPGTPTGTATGGFRRPLTRRDARSVGHVLDVARGTGEHALVAAVQGVRGPDDSVARKRSLVGPVVSVPRASASDQRTRCRAALAADTLKTWGSNM